MGTDPITTFAASPVDHRPAVTVLAGLSPAATGAVVRVMQVTDPHLLVVRHDISRIRDGIVRRTVRTATETVEDATVELVHGCVSCTLREDVLPTLVRLSRRRPRNDIVLVLPQVVEPEAVAAACAHCLVDGAPVTDAVRIDSYVTVVDATQVLGDLTSTQDLRDRGLHAAADDHRTVADVAARQIEYADTVLLWGHPDLDGFELARLSTLLHRLAPWATHFTAGTSGRVDCADVARQLRRTGRGDPRVPGLLNRAMEGFPIGLHEPVPECGIVSVLFESRRPFHPQRLHDALQDLTEMTLRGRGQLWIASQPDAVVAFECAGGGVAMGGLGHWLAALPERRWDEVSDYRRITADLNWDPYYGDRRTVLAFVGQQLDAAVVTELLDRCLLTDAEIADGFAAWTTLPDPFAGCFPLTDDTDDSTIDTTTKGNPS